MTETEIDDDLFAVKPCMEMRRCRVFICPYCPEEYGREPEFWYYEAAEHYASAVGCSILYFQKWTWGNTFICVQIWDDNKRSWEEHSEEHLTHYMTPVSQDEVDHLYQEWRRQMGMT